MELNYKISVTNLNLKSRLSARTGDGDVLTSPKSLLDFSLEPDHSSEIKGLVDTVCDWYDEKPKAATHLESNNTPGCCVPTAISRLRLEEDLLKVINLRGNVMLNWAPLHLFSAS